MSTTAVIGARGFLGRALVPALREAGVPTAEFTRAIPFLLDDGTPAPALRDARTVYYLASTINPAVAERQPDAVAADTRLFESFLGCLGALDRPTVVLPSSGGTVYDPATPPPYAETAPTRPKGRYGAVKLEFEERLRAATDAHAVLRISNVYGPGQPTGTGQGVVAHWLAAAAKGEPILLFGNPEASRDYVYVDDVAAALVAAGAAAEPVGVVNVGSGVPTSLGELAAIVQDVVGELEIRREGDRGFDVAHTWLDVRVAKERLGWEPQVPLVEGVRRTWAAVRDST